MVRLLREVVRLAFRCAQDASASQARNCAPMSFIRYILIQMRAPLETSELLAFTQTVEAKSLSRAASELRVPRATISRRLARLEKRLRARLLRRSTRSLALTDAGEALYRHARIVLEAAAAA